ncbi:MAG: CAP domain-containing protein [Verrucomicrobiota bacterium]
MHMNANLTSSLLAMLCAGSPVVCANPAQSIQVPVAVSQRSHAALSTQVFDAVNAYRHSVGATELQRHAGLDRLAQQHCEYLRQHRGTFTLRGKNVSHIGFEGRAMYARAYYQMDNISENAAAVEHAGANPGPTLVTLWKASKDHQHAMVDSWTHSGLGLVVDSDGMLFAVQLFATVNPSLIRNNRF